MNCLLIKQKSVLNRIFQSERLEAQASNGRIKLMFWCFNWECFTSTEIASNYEPFALVKAVSRLPPLCFCFPISTSKFILVSFVNSNCARIYPPQYTCF
jgi:hypothetical protein